MASNYTMYRSPLATIQSETEIRDIFDRHTKALFVQKWKIHEQITEWENELIRQIRENIVNQKALLEKETESQLQYIYAKRDEILDIALIYEKENDREQIRQLLDECHALKFELAIVEYPEQAVTFIQIKKEKQSTEVTPDSSSTHTFEDERIEKKSTVRDDFTTDDSKNERVRTPAKSIFTSSIQINQQPSTISSTDHNRLRNDNNNLNSHLTGDDGIVEKCPACFMIFPTNMLPYDRSQHVNEHFADQ